MTGDNFPLDCDYGTSQPYRSNITRVSTRGGREVRRLSGPPQRMFSLAFRNRAVADWNTLDAFFRKVVDDFFSWTDPTSGRKFSVLFAGEPRVEYAGHETVNITTDLIEAVDVALATYPSSPEVSIDDTTRYMATATSVVVVYGGYGFSISDPYDCTFDGDAVILEASGGRFRYLSTPLRLHRLEISNSGAPPAIAAGLAHFIA
jgi:hypothetical protein